MFKIMIAGVTALALTLSTATPVQAQDTDHEAIAKLLFGALALTVVTKAIRNNNQRDNVQTHVPQQVSPQVTQRHLPQYAEPRRHANRGHVFPQRHNNPIQRGQAQRRNALVLPRQCLTGIETRFGTYRLFTGQCLERNYRFAASLPRKCAVRLVQSNGAPRRGFDPACLRAEGYRARR